MVRDAGQALGRQQVSGGCFGEQDGLVLVRGRQVEYIDHGIDARERDRGGRAQLTDAGSGSGFRTPSHEVRAPAKRRPAVTNISGW